MGYELHIEPEFTSFPFILKFKTGGCAHEDEKGF
jgi:hypothetical protein